MRKTSKVQVIKAETVAYQYRSFYTAKAKINSIRHCLQNESKKYYHQHLTTVKYLEYIKS